MNLEFSRFKGLVWLYYDLVYARLTSVHFLYIIFVTSVMIVMCGN